MQNFRGWSRNRTQSQFKFSSIFQSEQLRFLPRRNDSSQKRIMKMIFIPKAMEKRGNHDFYNCWH